MRKLILLVGTAALAAATPALAEKGGKGGGGHGGGGKAAKVNHGGGGGGGGGKGAKHGGGHAMHAKPAKAERQAFHGGKPAKAERQTFRAAKPAKQERQAFRAERPAKAERQALRRDERQFQRGGDRRDAQFYRDDNRGFAASAQNCPPGLARKGNGCLPPGQAKKLFGVGDRFQAAMFSGYALPQAYRSFYADSPEQYYRYDDQGYIYQVDRGSGLIDSIIPLLGGGFGVGQPLPSGYDVYNVPMQYRDDYYDTNEDMYRYGDNAIYRVDSGSGMIESIVALLAGDLNVGQELPDGYDAYNVPYDYRDEYQDSDEHLYRYADGNIYQVDAKTQIVQAIIQMLT
jgi:hypothetical protein